MSEEKWLDNTVASLGGEWVSDGDSEEDLRRKLGEQRLLTEQLSFLGSAVRVAGQGIAILTPAVETIGPRIAFVNDGFCAMYGVTREEVIGQTPIIFGIVDRHQAIFDDLLDHVFDGLTFEAEATARRKDGSEFELDLQ